MEDRIVRCAGGRLRRRRSGGGDHGAAFRLPGDRDREGGRVRRHHGALRRLALGAGKSARSPGGRRRFDPGRAHLHPACRRETTSTPRASMRSLPVPATWCRSLRPTPRSSSRSARTILITTRTIPAARRRGVLSTRFRLMDGSSALFVVAGAADGGIDLHGNGAEQRARPEAFPERDALGQIGPVRGFADRRARPRCVAARPRHAPGQRQCARRAAAEDSAGPENHDLVVGKSDQPRQGRRPCRRRVVDKDGQRVLVKARLGVVFAAGGFPDDDDLRKRHFRHVRDGARM